MCCLIAGRATSRLQRGVLVVQLAFTALLVGGATGIGSAFLRLEAADPGFTISERETFRIALPWSRYSAEDGSTLRFHRALESKLMELPGVAQVAWSTYLPLAMRRGTAAGTVEANMELTLEGQGVVDQQRNPQVLEESVSPNYVDAMGMMLLQGRSFAASDHRDAPRVGLLNRRAAERLWPGESPLGKRLKVGRPDSSAAWLTVVGVVEDVRHDAAAVATTPTLYTSTDQLPHPNLFVVVRHRGVPVGPEAAAAAVRAIDPDQSIYEHASLPSLHAAQLWQQRLTWRLFTVFAICALGLALVGTHGLVSLWMQQRQREIGIRCALGATERDLRRMSRREALRIALAAALVALPGAAVVATWSSRLVALEAGDVALLAAGALAALGIAVVMMLLPAWRRSGADALAPLLRA